MKWNFKYTYTQSKNTYCGSKEIDAETSALAIKKAHEYVKTQNAGEPKSDRIKYKSVTQLQELKLKK